MINVNKPKVNKLTPSKGTLIATLFSIKTAELTINKPQKISKVPIDNKEIKNKTTPIILLLMVKIEVNLK